MLHSAFRVAGIIICTLLVSLSLHSAFAAPPGSQYLPGETLSPSCTPGSVNCSVRAFAVSGANTDVTSLTGLTTPLSVPQGGSGTSTLTTNSVLLGNGASGFQSVVLGSLYQVFRVPSGGGAPAFGAIDLSQSAAVTGAVATANGGLGLASAPSFGQIPVGNISGGYTLTATSSLGLIAGSIGGANTQVQFNDGGSFGGDAGMTYDKVADRLTVVNSSSTAVSSIYASSTQLVAGSFTLGSLSGFLKATAGAVASSLINLASDVTGIMGIANGGTGTSTAFTAGSIVFATTSGVFSQNAANFSWDNASNRLQVVGTIAGTHLKGLGSTPGIAANTGAGIGGITAPIVSVSGTDSSGEITVTTGNGVLATGAAIFTLTFASPYASAPRVVFAPANALTALLSGATNVFGWSTASTMGFTSGTTALTLLTTYKWTYLVIE